MLGDELNCYFYAALSNANCVNKWNRGGNVFTNELERGTSVGSNSSSSTNSSSISYNNNMDNSVMSSLSSNSSTSSSSCLSTQRAANINKSFQKHFQNLTALQRPEHFEQMNQSPIVNIYDTSTSCSSSSSLTSLDRRLCKTLPRKLTKGIVATNQIMQNNLKSEVYNLTDMSVANATFNPQASIQKSSIISANEFVKRNSDPYLDSLTKGSLATGGRNKSSEMMSGTSQRHSFGGLIVHRVVPPPPKYKGVHFAPNVEVSKRDKTPSPEEGDRTSELLIPTEGLPTRPARAPPTLSVSRSAANNGSSIIIPKTSETIPIVVKNVSDRPPLDKIVSSVTNSSSNNVSNNLAITRRSSSLTFNGGLPKANNS